MIKEEKRLEAVHHARKYFTAAESDQMEDIQKVMALLGTDTRSVQRSEPEKLVVTVVSQPVDVSSHDILCAILAAHNFRFPLFSYSIPFEHESSNLQQVTR